jgi:hypothetical protein
MAVPTKTWLDRSLSLSSEVRAGDGGPALLVALLEVVQDAA